MNSSYYLAVLAMAAGILVLLGTIVLLFFRRIYLDSETRQPVQFFLPLFGHISTQTPVIVLMLFGVFLVTYGQWQFKQETLEVPVKGYIDPGDESILVKIVPDSHEGSAMGRAGPFSHNIPVCGKNPEYRILFLEGKQVIDDQQLTNNGIEYGFSDVVWTTTPEETLPLETQKEASDEHTPKRSKPK